MESVTCVGMVSTVSDEAREERLRRQKEHDIGVGIGGARGLKLLHFFRKGG